MSNNYQKSGFVASVGDALNPKTWMKKVIIILVLGFVFAGIELIFFADRNAYAGVPIYLAFLDAYRLALLKFLASIYVVIKDLPNLINIGAWFTLGFGFFMLYMVTTIIYQAVDWFVNMFDWYEGKNVQILIPLLGSLGLVFIGAFYVNQVMGVESLIHTSMEIVNSATPLIENATQSVVNVSLENISQSEIPVISLGE